MGSVVSPMPREMMRTEGFFSWCARRRFAICRQQRRQSSGPGQPHSSSAGRWGWGKTRLREEVARLEGPHVGVARHAGCGRRHGGACARGGVSGKTRGWLARAHQPPGRWPGSTRGRRRWRERSSQACAAGRPPELTAHSARCTAAALAAPVRQARGVGAASRQLRRAHSRLRGHAAHHS